MGICFVGGKCNFKDFLFVIESANKAFSFCVVQQEKKTVITIKSSLNFYKLATDMKLMIHFLAFLCDNI